MSKKQFSSFGDLSDTFKPKTRKDKERELLRELEQKGRTSRAAEKQRPVEPPPAPDEEENLFFNAMQGVARIDGGGREFAPPTAARPAPFVNPADNAEDLRRFLNGDVEFDLQFTDEYMQGMVRGLDQKIFQKLKAGSYSVEGTLDLHGSNSEQALDALLFFLRESHLQGKRCLLVVTGRGKNSPGGQSVLKQEIQNWLVRDPLRRMVLAFCTARPQDGGAGALYVLLRKYRKTQGKVRFDKIWNWDDEL